MKDKRSGEGMPGGSTKGKIFRVGLLPLLAMLACSGCLSHRTTIASLRFPAAQTIAGVVSDRTADGFVLIDPTGTIEVRTVYPNTDPIPVFRGERCRVKGNPDGSGMVFDAYEVDRQDGTKIDLLKR